MSQEGKWNFLRIYLTGGECRVGRCAHTQEYTARVVNRDNVFIQAFTASNQHQSHRLPTLSPASISLIPQTEWKSDLYFIPLSLRVVAFIPYVKF